MHYTEWHEVKDGDGKGKKVNSLHALSHSHTHIEQRYNLMYLSNQSLFPYYLTPGARNTFGSNTKLRQMDDVSSGAT